MNEIKYIVIEGIIGSGKTSLAQKLAQKLNSKLIEEEFENNPFLGKFYEDRRRFAFQTQMFFLVNRYKQQQQLNQEDLFANYIVSDYMFNKDQIFAYLNLEGEELKLYENIFPLLERELRKPDLVVYLQSTVDRVMSNIKRRGRKIERWITRNYLNELNEAYNDYFFKYNQTPLLIVNSAEIDFVKNESDFEELYKQIFREEKGFMTYFNPEPRSRES